MLNKNDFHGVFIKVGQEDHLKSLKQKGMLHCKTLNYFAEIEDGGRRGDKMENAVRFFNGNYEMTISPGDKEKEIKFKVGKAIFSEKNQPVNIFCLYSVDIKDYQPSIPIQLEAKFIDDNWGTHFIVITHVKDFLDRVKSSLRKTEFSGKKGFVKYTDLSSCNMKNDGFLKDNRYGYQKEFRLRFETTKAEDINLFIGDISDITSTIYPIEQLATLGMKYEIYETNED